MTQKFMPVKEVTIFDIEYKDYSICKKLGIPVEVWNLGAVKVDRFGNIKDTFERYCGLSDLRGVTPDIERLCKFDYKTLTGMPKLETIKLDFQQFVGRSNLMCYGYQDYEILGDFLDFAPYPRFDGLSFVTGVLSDCDFQHKSYSLPNLCEYYGISSVKHLALADSICLANLLRKLLES